MKIDWVTVTVNMHTMHSLTQHIQAELSHTWACRILSPAIEEVSWILQLFCILQRKNWLAIARGNQNWPPSDTRSRIKKKRHYFHTANTHTPTHSRYYTWRQTTDSKCSFVNHYASSKAFLFDMAFNGRRGAEHRSIGFQPNISYNGSGLSHGFNCGLGTEC